MKIRKIDIQSISGFKIGNSENIDKGTGCTVIICEDGALGAVDVRGGAASNRETDLLRLENTVDTVNAVVLSGGASFGLEAASGVMRELAARGIGFDSGYCKIPIVCAASLFDLSVGDPKAYPDLDMGIKAARNAFEGKFEHGNRGAGTGASVGKFCGMSRAMKAGLGTFACTDEYLQVGAVVAVNAMGDIYNGAGSIIAGLRTESGTQIYGSIKSLKPKVHEIQNIDLIPKEEIKEEIKINIFEDRRKNKEEIADAIRNAFSNKINKEKNNPDKASSESLQSIEEEAPAETKHKADPQDVFADGEDQGYDISFNTTIACVITNAELTKSQADKLASILHDAYARAIKPVHSTMDGDTIFVLSKGSQKVNFDAFAALATDVLQYAIIDAASSAESAYGLPSASDIIK